MTRRTFTLALLVALAIGALAIWQGRAGRDRQLLRDVYSPTFDTVPPAASLSATLAKARTDLATRSGQDFLNRLLPDQAGVLWITVIVAIGVAFEFGKPRSGRNVDLVLALLLGASFFDIMRFFRVRMTPETFRLLDLVYTTVFALNLALLVRAVLRAARKGRPEGRPLQPQTSDRPWRPNIHGRALASLAVALIVCDVAVALTREPDDAGFFINLGAQRLRERGRLPYGDPLLTNTPGAAYGPVLYVAHIPFQFLIEPQPPNPNASARPPLSDAATYYLPPPLATKLCTIAFHLAGLLALYIIGVRLTGEQDVGWGLVALYAGSAFVLGVGGQTEFIGGMTFVSHIAPAAATLVAFACLPIPWLAGVFLAVATGAGFYPAFMFPAWAGFFWRDRDRLVRFVAGFAVAAAIIGGGTLALSRPADGRGLVGTVLHDTFGHHTDPTGYGRSPFGFWGQREGVRKYFTLPLVGESGLTSPTYVLLFGLVAFTFIVGRRASASQLALLTAAIGLAFSAIKIQPTGTYVAWAYPFLLIGIFANRHERLS